LKALISKRKEEMSKKERRFRERKDGPIP